MLQIDNHFLSIDISAHKLAVPGLAHRFCVVEDRSGRSVTIEVLARRTSAHRVSRLAIRLGLSWQLIFDADDGPCVIFKIAATATAAPIMAKGLRKLRFQRQFAAAQ